MALTHVKPLNLFIYRLLYALTKVMKCRILVTKFLEVSNFSSTFALRNELSYEYTRDYPSRRCNLASNPLV